MRNAFRILKRDVLRLIKVPPAMVVIIALLILPSVYTWYNVIGFWDPYNNTGNLRVEVVNQDKGASSDLTGEMNVGDKIVDALHDNDQLEWDFTDYDQGMSNLESGDAYAMFVIPEDFTEDLLTITTGDFVKPEVTYYVNEKLGPVAPKITDTGSTTLDETINSTFVSTVSHAAVSAIDESIQESKESREESQSKASTRISQALESIDESVISVNAMKATLESLPAKIQKVRDTLASAKSTMQSISSSLSSMSDGASSMRSTLAQIASDSRPAIDNSISLIAQTSQKATSVAQDLIDAADKAQADLDTAIDEAQNIVDSNDDIIAALESAVSGIPDGTTGKTELQQAIKLISQTNDRAKEDLRTLRQASDKAKDLSASASANIASLDATIQSAANAASGYSSTLFDSVIPSIESALSGLASVASSASSAIAAQSGLIDSANSLTTDMDSVVGTSIEALDETASLLSSLKEQLDLVRSDVVSISQSDALSELLGEDVSDGFDPELIADFMGSPTNLVTEQLYELNAYGAAMAPLFMNLTFWIGAFMLMVIMRQEVDGKGIRGLTLTQRYMGRFFLFAIMVILQASICCAGLPVIGVEVQSLPALFFAAIIAALSYLSIIYALSISLQHIGKGICIILVFAQIPGATGLYPIEMTAPFFQAFYPVLPFTYGISAMRESICGFYGSQYMLDICMLLIYFFVFMAVGILVRPLLSNVNRMVARQIKQSGIYNGEDVQVPVRRYRFSQVVRALTDKEEYKRELDIRYDRFKRMYPKLIKGCVIVGIAVPIIFTVVFTVNMNEKIVVLVTWLIWLVLVSIFLVVVESLRASFERQMKLDDMSESELRNMYLHRNGVETVTEAAPAANAKKPARHVKHDRAEEDEDA